MNADQILARTFADHEHLAPDPDAVLAGLQHRSRPGLLPVAAAAGTVAAVVIGATVLLQPDPAPLPAAGRPPVSAAPAPRLLVVPTTISIAAGGLPAGTVTPSIMSNSYGQQARAYDITGADGTRTNVLLNVRPGTALPTENKRGVPHDVTIGGRPAREWIVAGWYTAATTAPGGRIVTVELTSYQKDGAIAVPAATVAAAGRDVLAHVQLNRKEVIATTFTLTYAPPGLAVRSVSADPLGGTWYELAKPTAKPGGAVVYVEQTQGSWATGQKGKPRPPAKAGRPVQGHRTWVTSTTAGPQLFVDELRPGISISLGPAPLAELYKIADGIRWTG